ncbi:MAG: hypothetical protein ACJ788_06165 [Ktedonobacteraceae bacterium]
MVGKISSPGWFICISANGITELVASEPNGGSAGSFVEMWVKVHLDNWFAFFPGRNKKRDEETRLLAWDLLLI